MLSCARNRGIWQGKQLHVKLPLLCLQIPGVIMEGIPTVSESIVTDALLPTLNTPSGSDIGGDVMLAKKCENVFKSL